MRFYLFLILLIILVIPADAVFADYQVSKNNSEYVLKNNNEIIYKSFDFINIMNYAIENMDGGSIRLSSGMFEVGNGEIKIIENKPISIYGSGIMSTQIIKKQNTVGNVFNITKGGSPTVLADMSITAESGGNFNVDGIYIGEGNTHTLKNLWVGGFKNGVHVEDNSGLTIEGGAYELSQTNIRINNSHNIIVKGITSYQASNNGIVISNTMTTPKIAGGLYSQSGVILDSNILIQDIPNAIYLKNAQNIIISNNIIYNTPETQATETGIYAIDSLGIQITGNSIIHMKDSGIYLQGGNSYTISGNRIAYTGNFVPSVPIAEKWAIFSNAEWVTINNNNFERNIGGAIKTVKYTIINSNTFVNNNLDIIYGNSTIVVDTDKSYHSILINDNQFYLDGGTGSGKTAIFIPHGRKVNVIGNDFTSYSNNILYDIIQVNIKIRDNWGINDN